MSKKLDFFETDSEIWSEDYIVCPHCKHKHDELNEIYPNVFEDYQEYECEECEKEFLIRTYVQIEYITSIEPIEEGKEGV